METIVTFKVTFERLYEIPAMVQQVPTGNSTWHAMRLAGHTYSIAWATYENHTRAFRRDSEP
jgi:hypothetical protein